MQAYISGRKTLEDVIWFLFHHHQNVNSMSKKVLVIPSIRLAM